MLELGMKMLLNLALKYLCSALTTKKDKLKKKAKLEGTDASRTKLADTTDLLNRCLAAKKAYCRESK